MAKVLVTIYLDDPERDQDDYAGIIDVLTALADNFIPGAVVTSEVVGDDS